MSSATTQTSRARVRNLVIAVAGIAVILGIFWLTRDLEGATTEAAPDVTLEYFDGSSRQLSELRGKPVVLNFWASWCPPCVAEMPDLGDVHRRFVDEVEFVGVNFQEIDLEAAVRLAEETQVDYPLAHDPEGAIYNQFGGIAMPTTVFISADGGIERVHAGVIFADELIGFIESQLLG